MTMAEASSEDSLSYRQRDVDDTLDEHDNRISRLEKAALIGAGYGLAEGSKFVTDVTSLVL